jgi:D-aminopeptidase
MTTRVEQTAPDSPAEQAGLQAGDLVYEVNDTVISLDTQLSDAVQQYMGEELTVTILRDDAVSPLFQAAAEAAEEAILNSLFKAVRTEGKDGHVAEALPLDRVRELLK